MRVQGFVAIYIHTNAIRRSFLSSLSVEGWMRRREAIHDHMYSPCAIPIFFDWFITGFSRLHAKRLEVGTSYNLRAKGWKIQGKSK